MALKKIAILFLFTCITLAVFAQDNEKAIEAEEYFKNSEYDKSLPIYKQLYQGKNGDELYYSQYLAVLLKLKFFDDAEKIILKKIKIHPQFKIDLGQLYLEKGDPISANKIFDSIIQKMPANPFEITDVANSFYTIGNYDDAIKTFLTGRKILHKEEAFAYELINLYSFKKLKANLIDESINLIIRQPEYLQMIKNVFIRTFEGEEDYLQLKTQILKRIQKDPQNIHYIDLLAWLYIQQKQFDLALNQMIALDKRTDQFSGQIYAYGELFAENKNFNSANKAFQYLTEKGKNTPYYLIARLSLLNSNTQESISKSHTKEDLISIAKSYELFLLEFGKNNQTILAIRQLANLNANYLQQYNEAEVLLEEALNIKQLDVVSIAEIKLELADIYLINNNRWDAALFYGQVEKSFSNEPLGQEAKFRNAKLSFYFADFIWAKAQLDVLKASTSQFIANDALDLSLLLQDQLSADSSGLALNIYAQAELSIFKKRYEQALNLLDSIEIKYAKNNLAPEILMSKSKIYIQQKEYQKAANTLAEITEKYTYSIWADNALYNLANLEEQELNYQIQAQKHYEQLISNFPGSLFASEARKRFRNLRGDR
jgi:tetratricopeptide (TPR) repeat protein